jgi:membrane protein YqaA with SNARE-associated domain
MTQPGGTTSPFDWAAIIGGILTLGGLVGGAFKYLFGRADRREERQQKREDDYVKKIEARLEKLEREQSELWACFSLVANALHHIHPTSAALVRASLILGDAFPIDLSTPEDMKDTLGRIDEGKKP